MGKQNRDIPLGGPTTVTDTTSYGRQPFPKPNVSKAIQAQQEKEAREKLEKEAREKLEKARRNLEKDFTKPLNPKA